MHYEDLITDVPGAKRELVWFVLILFALTSINVAMLFSRQQPLIDHRKYDYQSSFMFKRIMHDGESRFKACFHKSVAGGFYLCFLFVPPKPSALREGRYSPERFERMFVDADYIKKYVDQFRDKRWEQGKNLRAFDIAKVKDSYKVTPVF